MVAEPTIPVELTDDAGRPVVYAVVPLRAGAGIRIMRKLIKGLKALESVDLKGLVGAGVDADNVDLSGLASAIETVAEIVAENGDEKFFKDLLGETSRRYADQSTGQAKSASAAFDSIYARNYGELFKITYHILMINFKPAFEGFFGKNLVASV